jgi:hypothetical protein
VSAKRNIPKDHPYDPKSLKPMAKMLWAMSISLGHALTAYRQFNRLKSVSVSPDGLLGGHGYVMPIPEMRKRLFEACEAISAISDTIHDEINAPHWKPRLAELDPNTAEDVERFVEEAAGTLENPEEDAEDEMEGIEKENDARWRAKGVVPEKDEPASEMPSEGPGGQDRDEVFHGGWGEKQKEASDRLRGRTARVIMIDDDVSWKTSETTLPVECEPGGPRVDHIGPGEGTGPYGTFNPGTDDAWEDEVDGHSPLDMGNALGGSGMPVDPTPTDADDFGVGFGQHGEGAKGYGARGPHGEVFGPASGLPDDPGGRVHDPSGDSTPSIETHIPPTGDVWAAGTMLPNDDLPPVARTDYYPGPNDHVTSELPGDESVTYNYDRDTPNVGQTFEHTDNPYIKWDYTTKNYRPDPAYQRDPREEG